MLATESGAIELAPELLVADVERLRRGARRAPREAGFVLIGRRHLRSNNSWMHNLPALAKGKERCTLLVHPEDARALGLAAGGRARVRSRVGAVEVPVEISDAMMRGVVSLPHGHGHDAPGAQLSVAGAAARRELEPALRRDAARRALGQRRAERDPRRDRAGLIRLHARASRRSSDTATPASAAPTIGATQKSQSCASAQPPTKSAGPVLRAGFTDVFVTGMLIRWISVRPSPIAIGAKPAGARAVGRAEDDDQEHEGQHDLGDEARPRASSRPASARRSRSTRSPPARSKPALPLAIT